MRTDRRVKVHGHRGARAVRPENTLAAFEYAIEAGVDAIEMDVVLAPDGLPVVSHDPIRRRTPGIPSLDEVLALADRGDFLFNIELKTCPAAAAIDVIRRRGVEDRVMLQSFDRRKLVEAARLAPEIPRGAIFAVGVDFAGIAHRAGAAIAVPACRLVTEKRVRRAHEAGVPVYTWTANRPRQWARLLDCGVDVIITDDPASLIAWLRQP